MTDTTAKDTTLTTDEVDFLDALEQKGGGETRSPIVQERDGVPPQERPAPEKATESGDFDLWDEGEGDERSPIVQERSQNKPVPAKKSPKKPSSKPQK